MAAQIVIRTLLCVSFISSMLTTSCQSTDRPNKWFRPVNIGLTIGTHFTSSQIDDPSTPPIRNFGDVSPGLTVSLTAGKILPISKTIHSEFGLGVRHTHLRVYDQEIFLQSPLIGNDVHKKTETHLRFLEFRVPVLLGVQLKNKKLSYAIGGFAAYRFTDSSFSNEQKSTYGASPVVVSSGGGLIITPTSHSPQVTSKRISDLLLPADKFQFGVLAKVVYSISLLESLNDFNVGLSVQRYLSNNEIWSGHELEWRSELLISTQF